MPVSDVTRRPDQGRVESGRSDSVTRDCKSRPERETSPLAGKRGNRNPAGLDIDYRVFGGIRRDSQSGGGCIERC